MQFTMNQILRLFGCAPAELFFVPLLWYQEGLIMKSYFVNFLYDHYSLCDFFPKFHNIIFFLVINFDLFLSTGIMHFLFAP